MQGSKRNTEKSVYGERLCSGSGGRRAGSSKILFNKIITDLPLMLVYGLR